jgi:drug/metabolite transporter (DMT)-like permease
VWGFTKAPIPMVGALREFSIFFSIFIGYFFLKEKITPTKIFSIILIVAGVIGLKLF